MRRSRPEPRVARPAEPDQRRLASAMGRPLQPLCPLGGTAGLPYCLISGELIEVVTTADEACRWWCAGTPPAADAAPRWKDGNFKHYAP